MWAQMAAVILCGLNATVHSGQSQKGLGDIPVFRNDVAAVAAGVIHINLAEPNDESSLVGNIIVGRPIPNTSNYSENGRASFFKILSRDTKDALLDLFFIGEKRDSPFKIIDYPHGTGRTDTTLFSNMVFA